MMLKKVFCIAVLVFLMSPLTVKAESEGTVILDTLGFWRSYFSYSPVVTSDSSGKIQKVGLDTSSPLPPEDWMAAEFDDANWFRAADAPFSAWSHYLKSVQIQPGFIAIQGDTLLMSVLCLRGKFNVAEPSRAGKMNLSFAYRGGVVVYVNGKEVARANLPKEGKLAADAPAEAYSKEAYFDDKGELLTENDKYLEQLKVRIRTLENVVIPKEVLIKGTNVLAIEIHRSSLPKEVYEKIKSGRSPAGERGFDGCGLVTARLSATGSGVTQNAVRPSKTQIWNSQPLAADYDTDWGDPNEPLRPIILAGAKNGFFSGKVVVGSASSIKRIKAVITELSGKNGEKIPADAVQIRYAVTDLVEGSDALLPIRLDKLEEVAPKEVPVSVVKASNYLRSIPGSPAPVAGAVLPVWVTVNVPEDAKPADYEGELSISVDSGSFKVPVKLRVYNYKIPNPADFTVFAELIQSPETLAIVYKVPLWSEKHWKLIEQSLYYVGAMGTKTCYIPLICKTNMGNAETMVRWTKDKDKFKYDFTIMEKYLDLVEKYQGKPAVVCFYVWDHFLEAAGEYIKGKNVSKEVDEDLAESKGKGPEVTLLKNGKAEDFSLPMYSETAAAKAAWKPLVEELKGIMKKRKLEKSMMIGIVSDRTPDDGVIKFWNDILPEAPWVKHAHNRIAYANLGGGKLPFGYTGTVWDLNTILTSMIKTGKASNGWKNKELSTFFARDIRNGDPAVTFRMMAEITSHGEQRGFARMGADFWSLKGGSASVSRFGSQHGSGVLASDGRFPKGSWLNLNIRVALLASGPDGALTTSRYEMMREGVQECEARIAVEKALEGSKLRGDQSKRCEKILTERNDAIYAGFNSNRYDFYKAKGNGGATGYNWACQPPKYMSQYYLSSGWQERSADLYDAAAEVTGTDKKAGFTSTFRELAGSPEPVKAPAKKTK